MNSNLLGAINSYIANMITLGAAAASEVKTVAEVAIKALGNLMVV